MIASGTDVTTVAGILGHAQPSPTLDIYAEATDDLKRSELANFEDYFNRSKLTPIAAK